MTGLWLGGLLALLFLVLLVGYVLTKAGDFFFRRRN